jgi:peptidoglycan/xylan/chitin deacetylase (PgdA/CDA1 family)
MEKLHSMFGGIAGKLKNRATQAVPGKLVRLQLSAPIASFTFDDFAKSAWHVGGKMVEGFGGRATYYVAGKFCGGVENGKACFDEGDLAELVKRGHDAACHTFDHAAVPHCSKTAIASTLSANLEFIKNATGQREITSFAYPFGLASVRTKRLLAKKYLACRGIYPGLNAGWTDFSQLSAICLHRSDLRVEQHVQNALRRAGWLIFVGHDVCDRPSAFGCTPGALENTLRLVSEAGIEIVTMDQALRRIFPRFEQAM